MSDKIRRGVDPTSVPRQGSCLRRVVAMPSDLRSLGAVSVTTDSGRVRAPVHDWRKYLYLSAVHRFLRESPAVDVHIVTQEPEE